MLLDPYSTFGMVRNNIDFLEEFVGDGWAVASFCRMLPYAGMPIKTKLESEGRLLGTAFEPDYRFPDPKLDVFYDWMLETFHRRNYTSQGLCHLLKSLLFEARLRLPGAQQFTDLDRTYVKHLNAISNGLALYTLRAAVDHIERTPLATLERDRSFPPATHPPRGAGGRPVTAAGGRLLLDGAPATRRSGHRGGSRDRRRLREGLDACGGDSVLK